MGSDEEMDQGPFQLENGKDGSPVLIAMGQLLCSPQPNLCESGATGEMEESVSKE